MDNPVALAKLLLPKVPFLAKTATWHTLGLSETSSKWDLKSELIIKMIRSMLDSDKPSSISKQQRLSLKDPGIKGKMHISKATLPAPEKSVLETLLSAVDALNPGSGTYTTPEVLPVEGEWTGYRPSAKASSPRADISEEEHYKALMADTTSDITILYIHGGALYLMDPATHRGTCSQLARLTGGRAFSVRYRLAPQNPFPAALLDVFIAYLSLLSPPPGATHTAVPASKIVFAGDSAGGNLSLTLLQLLLQLHRSNPNPSSPPSVTFHGKQTPIPLPAGVALNSPWTDLTAAFPSLHKNLAFDYLPPLTPERFNRLPACDLWPTDPPRGDLYCASELLLHPLVSPLAGRDWAGAPPCQASFGTEILADEIKAMVQRLAGAGVAVESWEWEAMPHVFAAVLQGSPMSARMLERWAGFMSRCVRGEEVKSRGFFVEVGSLKEKEVALQEVSAFSEEDVDRMMKESWERKMKLGTGGNEKMTARL